MVEDQQKRFSNLIVQINPNVAIVYRARRGTVHTKPLDSATATAEFGYMGLKRNDNRKY